MYVEKGVKHRGVVWGTSCPFLQSGWRKLKFVLHVTVYDDGYSQKKMSCLNKLIIAFYQLQRNACLSLINFINIKQNIKAFYMCCGTYFSVCSLNPLATSCYPVETNVRILPLPHYLILLFCHQVITRVPPNHLEQLAKSSFKSPSSSTSLVSVKLDSSTA